MKPAPPYDKRALVAVDLGAESCRVSLLRWIDGRPHIHLVHRFPNGPVSDADGSLRWPLDAIVAGVDHGMALCAALAPEGIRSVAVDGWAVDYVRLDAAHKPLAMPFCYRDERTVLSETKLHERISPERLRAITGLQLQPLNTLYQLYADKLADFPAGDCWVNLPEYLLVRWGAAPVAEYTNATHTQMVDLERKCWSPEILMAAGLDPARMPLLVPPGTVVGKLRGDLARLHAFADTDLVVPACHDTASAVAGIAAAGDDWGYISSGTWSLVGTLLPHACNSPDARSGQFTNLGAVADRFMFQKNVNGMWLLKQCMDEWASIGHPWETGALVAAAESAPKPGELLDVDDPELQKIGHMPLRVSAQRQMKGLSEMDQSAAGAPAIASLIFHSLAARYASLFARIEQLTGKNIEQIFIVGGGSRNDFLRRLTSEATGKPVHAGSPESSTLGNFAVQLAAQERCVGEAAAALGERTAHFASLLSG